MYAPFSLTLASSSPPCQSLSSGVPSSHSAQAIASPWSCSSIARAEHSRGQSCWRSSRHCSSPSSFFSLLSHPAHALPLLCQPLLRGSFLFLSSLPSIILSLSPSLALWGMLLSPPATALHLPPMFSLLVLSHLPCFGRASLTLLQELLDPHQVFDLSQGGPKPGLMQFLDVPGHMVRIQFLNSS